jgi:hypothetical protein
MGAIVTTAIRTGLFGWEFGGFLRTLRRVDSPTHLSALTLHRLLPWLVPTRGALFAASTFFSVLAIFNVAHLPIAWASIAFLTTFTSQILERYAFFTTVRAPKMPGGI